MSKQKCGYCGKLCRDKPIVGTLHICLSPEERSIVRSGWAQREMQKRSVCNYGPYAQLLQQLGPKDSA